MTRPKLTPQRVALMLKSGGWISAGRKGTRGTKAQWIDDYRVAVRWLGATDETRGIMLRTIADYLRSCGCEVEVSGKASDLHLVVSYGETGGEA